MKKFYFSFIFSLLILFHLHGQNNALDFDGSDDNVSIAANTAFDFTNKYSFETWMYVKGYQYGTLISKFDDDGNNRGWMINMGEAGDNTKLCVIHSNLDWSNHIQWQTNFVPALNTWYHVAVVFDGTLGTNQVKLYVNGVLTDQLTSSVTISANAANVYIGGYDGAGNGLNSGAYDRFFNGKLDELRLWSTALSASDIQSNMYKSLTSSVPGIVAAYNFNQGIGNGNNSAELTLLDNAGSKNGSLYNFGLSGTASNWTSGITTSGVYGVNNALQFSSGGSNYVALNNFITEFNNPFTIEMWAKVPSGGALSSLLFKDNGNGSWDMGEKCLYIDASGQPGFVGNWNGYIYSNQAINDGNWHHIAVTHDGASSGKIYIDGIDRSNGGGYNSYAADNSSGASTIYLGKPNYGEASYYFNGDMDELRIWNFEMSAENILANKNKNTLGTESGLVAYYNFDQGIPGGTNTAITSLIDKTANAYNGTLVNFTKTGSISNFVSSLTTINGIYAFSATSITGISSSQTVCSGITISLAVTATGTSLTYQWYKNGTSIMGATGSILTLTGVTSTNAGVYSVAISSLGGSITSSGISLGVGCNNALNFDGSDDYVFVNQTSSVRNLGISGFTLSAWVYPANASGVYSIIRKSGDYNLYINNGKIGAEVWPGGEGTSPFFIQTGSTSIPLNQWTNVAAVWNGTSFVLYVNGVLDPSSVNGSSVSSNDNLTIGRSISFSQDFLGSLDEIYIWNISLSQADIQSNYTKKPAATISGLVAYYDFDEGIANGVNATITTLIDKSGYSNSGTLNNFTLNGFTSNWTGSVITSSGTFTFAVPTITGITTSQIVFTGSKVPLAVTATGTSLTYQWKFNGINIPGATASTFTITGINTTSAGIYSIAISSLGGNITSLGISITLVNTLDNTGLTTLTSQVAYATRKLSTSYNGCAIRVRRTDNAEADVAFDGSGYVSAFSVITITAIGGSGFSIGNTMSFSTFYAVTNCFVTTWYDQSGYGRNATQGTGTSQPSIVSAGSLNTFSNKPSISFNGSSNEMSIPLNSSVINAQGTFSIVEYQSVLQNNFNAILAWSNGNSASPGFGPLNGAGVFGLYGTFNPANVNLGPTTANTSYVLNASWTSNGASVTESRNGTTVTGSLGLIFSQSIAIGFMGRDVGSFYNGKVSEIIILSTPLSTTDRVALETNQINLYIPPAITGITPSQTVCSGVTASLSVTSTGTSLTYQWYKNGASITGANASAIIFASVTATSIGTYMVVVQNSVDIVTSSGISLGIGCNNALDFDGSDDYVQIPYTSQMPTGNGDFSFEAWVNYKGGQTGDRWFGWFGAAIADQLVTFGIDANTNTIKINRLSAQDWVTGTALTPNVNTHLAFVYSGSVRTMNVYANGSLLATKNYSADLSLPATGTLQMGIFNGITTYASKIQLDEVRIWNTAIGPSDIQANMLTKVASTVPGLVAYYDFDQGIAGGSNAVSTTLTDRKGTKNGTLTNFALNGSTSNWVSSGLSINGPYIFGAPTITGISPSQTVCNGFTLPLAVTVSGSGLTYQWLKDGVAISAATASALTLTGVTATSAGIYSVAINGTGGSITSSGISLGVGCNNALNLDGANDNVTFGSLPLSGNNARTVEGWVKTSLTGVYQNPFSSGSPSYSQAFNIKITDFGTLGLMGFNNDYYPSTGAILNDGNWHHFAVSYDGSIAKGYVDGNLDWTTPLSLATSGNANYIGQSNDLGYPQYFNGTMDELRVWNVALSQTDIQTNRFRTVNGTIPGLLMSYDFNQGIAGGNNTSVTTLLDRSGNSRNGTLVNFSLNGATSNWITATNSITGILTLGPPTITGISPAVTVCSGASTSFNVTISGGLGSTYQWFQNGSAISGANSSTLILNSVTATLSGVYSVTVQNSTGSVTSSGISFGVTLFPTVTGITQATVTCVGTDVSLSLTAPGANMFQWYANAVSIPGANSSVLSISGATASAKSYYALVSNSCGSALSTMVGVNIADFVSVTGITFALNLCPGNNGVITISGAGGGAGVTFQWYNNAVPIVGANAINYTITGAVNSNTGTYFVVVNALCGSATSTGSNVAVNCNNSLSLDGADDFVEVTVPGVLNTNTFTVECWAYCTGGSSYKAVLSKRDAGGWIIYFDSGNNIALWNGYSPLITGPTASLNTWNHIAITSDNSGQSLYVNGILAGSSPVVLTPSPNNLRMGTDDGNQWYFGGKIDEVRLWNRVLSSTELQANLNCQLTGSELGLIAYYDFNQNAPGGNNSGKATLLDRTTNGNNGNLFNFALTGAVSNWIVGSTSVSGTCVPPTYAVYTIGGNGNFISNGSTGINTVIGTDFNQTMQGSAVSRSFSINNTGIPDVVITAVSITGVNAGDFSFSISPVGTITGGASANFTVDYNPASFCTGIATVKVFTNSLLIPIYQFNVSGNRILKTYAASVAVNSFCGTGITNVSLTGSELGVIYSLTDSFTSSTLKTISGTGAALVISNVTLTSGGYNLVVFGSNSGSGCQQVQMTGSMLTNVLYLPTVTGSVSPAQICEGGSATFTGSGALTYSWFGGVIDGAAAYPTVSGFYTVTGTDAYGCSNTGQKNIIVNSAPPIQILGNNQACPGIGASLSAIGGDTYLWSVGSTTSTIIYPIAATTVFSVTGTNTLTGCSLTVSKSIDVVSTYDVNTVPSPVNYGSVQSILLSTIAGQTYSLTSGSLPTGLSLNAGTGLISGTVSVIGTYGFNIKVANGGCTSTVGFSVNVTKAPLTIGVVDTVIYQNQSIPGLRTTLTGLAAFDMGNISSIGLTTATSAVVGIYSSYPSISGSALNNYNITTLAGALTIRSITGIAISPRNMSKQYALPNPTFLGAYSVDGIAVNAVSLSGANVVTINGIVETLTTTYATDANTTSGVGSLHFITLTGYSITNKYRYSITTFPGGQLTIDPLRLTIKADDKVWLEGQPQPTLTGVVKSALTINGVSGIVPGDDVQITYDYDDGTVLTTTGPFSVVPEAKGTALSNYSFIMFSGTVRKLSGLTVTSFNFSKTYGSQPPMSLITASGTGYTIVGWKGTSTGYNVDNKPVFAGLGVSAPVGQYAIVPILTGYDPNLYYLTTVPGVLTVNPAGLTVLAVNFTRTQGQSNPFFDPQITGLVLNETVSVTYDYSGANEASPVGNYVITPSVTGAALDNYTLITIAGTLTIGVAPGNLSVSVGNFTKVYGSDNPVFTGNMTGLVTGDDVSPQYVTTATANSPVGTYPINIVLTGADVGKYLVTTTRGTLTITKAPLTVKANDTSLVYGNPPKPFVGVITGLITGDNISVIYETSPLTNANSNAGTYPIIPIVTGTVLTNYDLTTTAGTLLINKATLTVLGATLTRVYGVPNPALTYNLYQFIGDDNIQDIDTVPIGTTTATELSPVGMYPIIYSQGADTNYVFNYTEGILKISKALQTITVSSVNAKVKTGESITLSAASSSGLPLSVAVADPTVLSANGLVISGLIDGISRIAITQGGDGNYEPADTVFVNVVSTSTGVLSVFSFVMAGTDTAYAGVSELTFTFAMKAGVTYQWSYTGTDVSRDNLTTANLYKIAFGNNATKGYVIGKVLDENGNIIKQDSIYVTVIKYSEADLLANPALADKLTAATLVKQLVKLDCEPVATDCNDAYILSFNFGKKLSNKSTCTKGGYGDFTTIGKVDSLIMGNAYQMRIVSRNNISSTNYFAIWIDYGNDGSFEDPDDFINASFSPDSVFEIKNVVIRNNDSYIGPRRVRIGMRTSGSFVKTESCPAEGTVGETEDYLIYVRKQDALEAPKLITPNNDGKNDLFIVKGINPKLNNKLSILDRWGNLKFERENYENDWDGKDQSGITMVDGTYFYFFTNGDNLIKGYVEIKTR